ncbi:MAG: hypothetical protein IPI19_04550 [Ignavibacteriales bacterium]|nr:hypothetical protein [Ignavibacteriales bacterium]MBP9120615.1 hypothetical protein [Ignavibacterium sp.]
MKSTLNLFVFVIALSFFTTGCYTIVWDPRQEFPDTENSTGSSGDFYDYDYYGGYVDYYEAPWWIPPAVYITNIDGTTDRVQTKDRKDERNSDTETIRNSNGRGNTDRNSGINTGTTTTTTNSGNNNNSNVVTPPPPTRDSGTSNTSTTTSTSNTRNSGNSGSNETRNSSSGSRNSGSGRR